ncbi:MAG: GspE/PulE family protein [Pseudomonadota bacterium]
MSLDCLQTDRQPALTAATSLDELRSQLHLVPRHRLGHVGESLVQRGLIDALTLQRALDDQRRATQHRLLGQILVDRGALTPAELDAALVEWLGVPTVDLRRVVPQADALRRIPREVALREGVLPVMVDGDSLVVAMPDPWDLQLLDQLRFICELRITPALPLPGTLGQALAAAFAVKGDEAAPPPARGSAPLPAGDGPQSVPELAEALRASSASGDVDDVAAVSESDNTLVRLVNAMIADALRRRASDIHIETREAPLPVRIRLRVDGDIEPYLELPASCRFALVSRVKIMAGLNIAEHRKPQDGKIDMAGARGPGVELRVVTVPTIRGMEDVVLRLLPAVEPMPLEGIGLSSPNLARLQALMARPYGLILVCGPTGSGKTTTLHSVMRALDPSRRKIWTAEDPVEITQDGLRQVQVNPRIGWTFAQAMRTFLRADPDVIMIGEMRDEETARIAVEASLTGHLVLSTLHTNNAPESVRRLLEIGLDPFNFSDSLLGVLSQRLARRLCTHCRHPRALGGDALRQLASDYLASGQAAGKVADVDRLVAGWLQRHGAGDGSVRIHERRGCARCDDTGYRGRLGLHELMVADEPTRALIRRRAGAEDLLQAALGAGMLTLRQDGIDKVLAGLTDLSEVQLAAGA